MVPYSCCFRETKVFFLCRSILTRFILCRTAPKTQSFFSRLHRSRDIFSPFLMLARAKMRHSSGHGLVRYVKRICVASVPLRLQKSKTTLFARAVGTFSKSRFLISPFQETYSKTRLLWDHLIFCWTIQPFEWILQQSYCVFCVIASKTIIFFRPHILDSHEALLRAISGDAFQNTSVSWLISFDFFFLCVVAGSGRILGRFGHLGIRSVVRAHKTQAFTSVVCRCIWLIPFRYYTKYVTRTTLAILWCMAFGQPLVTNVGRRRLHKEQCCGGGSASCSKPWCMKFQENFRAGFWRDECLLHLFDPRMSKNAILWAYVQYLTQFKIECMFDIFCTFTHQHAIRRQEPNLVERDQILIHRKWAKTRKRQCNVCTEFFGKMTVASSRCGGSRPAIYRFFV